MTGSEQKKPNDPQGSSESSKVPSSPQAEFFEHNSKPGASNLPPTLPNHIHPSYRPPGTPHPAQPGFDLKAQPKRRPKGKKKKL